MFGTYQSSNLRVELTASEGEIQASLTQLTHLKKWLWPQQLKHASSESLAQGTEPGTQEDSVLAIGQVFESQLGLVKITHEVEASTGNGVRFLLSGGIDGFHEWQWGDGWIQSRLEGISLLPLNLGQTLSLTRLKQYLQTPAQ